MGRFNARVYELVDAYERDLVTYWELVTELASIHGDPGVDRVRSQFKDSRSQAEEIYDLVRRGC